MGTFLGKMRGPADGRGVPGDPMNMGKQCRQWKGVAMTRHPSGNWILEKRAPAKPRSVNGVCDFVGAGHRPLPRVYTYPSPADDSYCH